MLAGKPSFIQIWFVAIAMVLAFSYARAQSNTDQVHITPRVQSSQPESLSALAKSATATIRKTVELVLVPVTVTDEYHRPIKGLEQENFQLYENKHPQPIKHFWTEDTPVSVGILLDVSGSTQTKIDRARDAIMALLKASNPEDEFFLVTFADRPILEHDFTQNVDDIQGQLISPKPKGRTSLIDAIFLSVDNMKKARYQRKALVVISDGGDNRSRYSEKDIKSLIKEKDVLVYSIGVFDSTVHSLEELLGPELLTEISLLTGASSYTLDNPNDLPAIAEHIAVELRNQYILGYQPDGSCRDGKWRKIKVKLALPPKLPTFRVQTRTGYYGPAW